MRALFATLVLVLLVLPPLYSTEPENNDFYDDSETLTLQGPDIEVSGEISNPGKVDFSKLPLRSVMVREAIFRENQQVFVGSYRYDGYSLFDILKERFVNKKNQGEFKSIIDLLVVVENNRGERVIFSWGEIFYPNVLHRILVAHRISRIVPSHTKEQWPLGEKTKLVCANDLISERNLEHPARIVVFSSPVKITADRTSKTPFSEKISVFQGQHKRADLTDLPANLEKRIYTSVFYGRGKGFHGIEYFEGGPFKSFLQNLFEFNKINIQQGYFVVSAIDGYRIALSFSELFNRNDQADFLIIQIPESGEKGKFRLFPAADFFSDRAVFAINAVFFQYPSQ